MSPKIACNGSMESCYPSLSLSSIDVWMLTLLHFRYLGYFKVVLEYTIELLWCKKVSVLQKGNLVCIYFLFTHSHYILFTMKLLILYFNSTT
jgi:hypothetical protein